MSHNSENEVVCAFVSTALDTRIVRSNSSVLFSSHGSFEQPDLSFDISCDLSKEDMDFLVDSSGIEDDISNLKHPISISDEFCLWENA